MKHILRPLSHLILGLHLLAHGASAWCALPEVNLANGPLYGSAANVHPNLLLSLSVEFPTVGIAYRGAYNRLTEYIGYFNPKMCYVYVGNNRNVTDGYFSIFKRADTVTHECGDGTFSGNFMNWAAASSIDMLRYALTGGDRVVDTAGMTILQRAVLAESPVSFYAHGTYFPRRTLAAGGDSSAPKQVGPFENLTKLYIVSCRNRILFSDGAYGGNCDTNGVDMNGKPLNTDKKHGEYLVRVQVCNGLDLGAETEGGRPALCWKYGSGYKPVGEVQKRSSLIRLGVTGYLLDNSSTRYGGVLRAPMKYVGPKKFEAPNFVEVPNERLEWDPATGVFYNNPEDSGARNSTSVNSGVINYLNKFGRSAVYKDLDPVGELYYESLRYLQGKQPTPDATSGMTQAMKDGFPVIQAWADPVTASCQDNNIVAIADVNTHWDRYIPGNDRTTYGGGANANDPARSPEAATATTPALDVKTWTKLVGDMEADAGGTYTNPAPNTNLTNLQNRDTGAGGHGTYYMAGLAYWANTNDIRLDKRVRVKTYAIDVDEGGNGLIDGNTRGIKPRDSQLYLAAKYGGFKDDNKDGNPFITFASDKRTLVKGSNAEWDNGSGVPRTYFMAGQPNQMIAAIQDIFGKAVGSSGTIAGVSLSSSKLATGGSFAYKPGFDPADWSGRLQKFPMTLNKEGTDVQIGETAVWDAGEILTGKEGQPAFPAPAARTIYTTALAADGSRQTVPFLWDRLSTAQQTLLNISPADGKPDGAGPLRLEFLRGDRSKEVGQTDGKFRMRGRVLGDIINGNPVYVAEPAPEIQGPGYQAFYDSAKSRTPAVYIGANDGMLHAFSAADGKELFAYVPSALYPKLAQLTDPAYAHQTYVDGTIHVAEAKIGSEWRTVLAAGLGAGAQGVFALDITNPANFGAGLGVIAEFSDSDDPDIGNVVGAPAIGKFRTGVSNGKPEFKHFLIVSSGFNNYKDDGSGRFNAEAPAALFLISLDKPAATAWKEGVNYFKFKPAQTPDTALANGLSAPAFVVGNDGAVRYVYAGDVQGNLWRFDFSGASPWSGAAPAKPLFTARDDKNNRQPITMQPKVVYAPGNGHVVLFGTGKYVEAADTAPGNFKTQSLYGIHDASQVSGRGDLAVRTLTKAQDGGYTVGGDSFSFGDKKGWVIDLPSSDTTGERFVTNPLIAFGNLFVNSLLPGEDPCALGGGRSYAFNAVTGLAADGATTTGFLSAIGLLSAPAMIEIGAMSVGDRNPIGKRMVTKKYVVIHFGTRGAGQDRRGQLTATLPAGRFSWREVLNWQELRRALNQ